MNDQHDKRQFQRAPVQLMVSCPDIKDKKNDHPMLFFSTDISMGGIFLATDDVSPVGTALRFELKLTDPHVTIHATGKVVRCTEAQGDQPKGMGIELEIADPNEKKFLEGFIAREMAKNL